MNVTNPSNNVMIDDDDDVRHRYSYHDSNFHQHARTTTATTTERYEEDEDGMTKHRCRPTKYRRISTSHSMNNNKHKEVQQQPHQAINDDDHQYPRNTNQQLFTALQELVHDLSKLSSSIDSDNTTHQNSIRILHQIKIILISATTTSIRKGPIIKQHQKQHQQQQQQQHQQQQRSERTVSDRNFSNPSDYHHSQLQQQDDFSLLMKQLHGILFFLLDDTTTTAVRNHDTNHHFVHHDSWKDNHTTVPTTLNNNNNLKLKTNKNNLLLINSIMECLKAVYYCPREGDEGFSNNNNIIASLLFLPLDCDEWNETFDTHIRTFRRLQYYYYSTVPTSNQQPNRSHSVNKNENLDCVVLHVNILDRILSHVTATNLSIHCQNNFVLGLLDLACTVELLFDDDNNSNNKLIIMNHIIDFVSKLANNKNLTNMASKAIIVKSILLHEDNKGNAVRKPNLVGSVRYDSTNEQFYKQTMAIANENSIRACQLFRLQCELLRYNRWNNDKRGICNPSYFTTLERSVVEVFQVFGGCQEIYEEEESGLVPCLLCIILNKDAAKLGASSFTIEERLIAIDCLIHLHRCCSRCHLHTKGKVLANCNTILHAFVQIILHVKDDYNLKSKAINGIHNCLYRTNTSQHDSFVFIFYTSDYNDEDEDEDNRLKSIPQSIIANIILINILRKDRTNIQQMISCVFEIIVFGQHHLNRRDDECQQISNSMVAANRILMDVFRSLMTLTQRNTRQNPPPGSVEMCWNTIPVDDLMSICTVILDIGQRNQHRVVGKTIVELTVDMLCHYLLQQQGEFMQSSSPSSSNFAEVLDALARVLMDTFASDAMKLRILETMHEILKTTNITSTTSDESKSRTTGCLRGFSWSSVCVSHPQLIEAFAREASLFVVDTVHADYHDEDTGAIDCARITRRRRSLGILILSCIATNVTSHRILAKHPSVLSSLVRFVRSLEESNEQEETTMVEFEQNSQNARSSYTSPPVQSNNYFTGRITLLHTVRRDDLKRQILSIANLL